MVLPQGKLALSAFTIKQADLETKLRIASEAGYTGIGLRYDEVTNYLRTKRGSIKDFLSLLQGHGLTVTEVGSLCGWQYTNKLPLICRRNRGPRDTEPKLSGELDQFFKDCRAQKTHYVLVVVAIDEEGTLEQGVVDFRKLCKRAELYGVSLALEFQGFSKSVKRLETAWDIVREADCLNGGLLFDTFHFYKGDSTLQELEEVPAEKIFLVHINDAKKLPLSQLQDEDRLLPGQGVIPLKQILKILNEKGYSGYFSLEVLNREYWAKDPKEIALNGRIATENLLHEAGFNA